MAGAPGTAGFISGVSQAKLDGIAAGATNTPLTSTAPVDVTKAAAAVGVATDAARADHKHDVSTAAPGANLTATTTNAEGTATSLARSDHSHALTTASPGGTGVQVGGTAAAGSAASLARSDHAHTVTRGTPVAVGTASAAGSSASFVGADHVHAHGSQPLGTGTDHAVATVGAAGFMSAADKVVLNGLATRNKFFKFSGNAATDVGDYSSLSLGSNGSVNITFEFPDDFTTLQELCVVGIPVSTFVAKDIDLTSDYAALGELYNNHQGSDTTTTYSGTADTILEYDATALFGSASAGDYAGLMIKHNAIGATIRYLGLRMRYI